MTGYLGAALGVLATLAMTALGGMASQEIRDRLDHLPHAILRLAARRLTPDQRTSIYDDEWLPELTYILKEAEARPVTRLITGTGYALGILVTARRIAYDLNREPLTPHNTLAAQQSSSLEKPPIPEPPRNFPTFLWKIIGDKKATRELNSLMALTASLIGSTLAIILLIFLPDAGYVKAAATCATVLMGFSSRVLRRRYVRLKERVWPQGGQHPRHSNRL